MFFPRLGHGRVGYDAGAVTRERAESWWYAYDPKDLAAVARGNTEPWGPVPATDNVDYPGGGTDVSGVAWDSRSNTLFVNVLYARPSGLESYPVIHAYRLKNP